MRLTAISVLALVLSTRLGVQNPPAGTTQPAAHHVAPRGTLRIVTFNVLSCRYGIDRIVAFLREQDADIICLQETKRGASVATDQPARIAAALDGMHVVSARTFSLPADQGCDQAILSRYELTDAATLALEPGGWVFGVQALVKIGGRDLHVLSVHTHSTFRLTAEHVIESSAMRLREVTHLLETVRKLEGDVIVAGDFNATPWMPEYYGITKTLTDFGKVNEDAKLSFPSHRPSIRIDYMFGKGALEASSYEVADVRLSDHRPVVTVVNLAATTSAVSELWHPAGKK